MMPGLNDQVDQLRGEYNARALQRYADSLSHLPEPGMGAGLHPALLSVANAGVAAGIHADRIAADLRQAIPLGGRIVSDREIRDAVELAVRDGGHPPTLQFSCKKSRPRYKPELLEALLKSAPFDSETDLVRCSAVSIPEHPEDHGVLLLNSLYYPSEFLFAGERYADSVRPASEWLKDLAANPGSVGPHIIPNPLTGMQGQTKTGSPSNRCDACVAKFRFAVVEFDNLDRANQIRFWSAVNLPVTALIDSGGKSIHGWIRVGLNNTAEWEEVVEQALYAERLVPLGVDAMCRTEARLSRIPGYVRRDTGAWQRLLYLAPEGRRVCK